jgi:hypothetical protein
MARERIFLDGWEITLGVVREWAVRAGTDGTTGAVGANGDVPNRTGTLWRPKVAGPGQFDLDVWVAGATRTEVEVAWRNLLRAARRPHRLIRITRHMASGEIVECDAELTGTIDPTHIAQLGMRAQLTFGVPSGVWKSQTVYTAQTVAGAALPQTLVLDGLEPSTAAIEDLVLVIKGAVAAPTVVDRTDGVDGDYLLYGATIAAGGSLRLDSATWGVTGAGGHVVNIANVNQVGRRYLAVPAARPGQTPTVELRGSGGGVGTQLVVTGRRAYAC